MSNEFSTILSLSLLEILACMFLFFYQLNTSLVFLVDISISPFIHGGITERSVEIMQINVDH